MCGDQLSANIAKETTSVMIDVINEAYSNCASASVQSETQTISGNDGDTIIIGKTDFYETASELTQCESTADFSSSISTGIQEAAQQSAEDINSSLDPFGGDSEAVNVVDITTQLGTTITDTFEQSCTYATLQNQSQDVIDNLDSTIIIGCTTFDEELEVMNQCILQSSAVQDVQTQLEVAVGQAATTKANNILIMIIVIVAIVFVVIVIVAAVGGFFALRQARKNKQPDPNDPAAVVSAAVQAKANRPASSASSVSSASR